MGSFMVLAVNDKQVKTLKVLNALRLITIVSCDDFFSPFTNELACKMVYVREKGGIATNLVIKLFNKGFLVSKEGNDRRNFNEIVTKINKLFEEGITDE